MHTHRGLTITASAPLAQPPGLLRKWAAAGHLAVDSETSAVFSAATAFGMRAASVMYVRDELPGRSWTDGTGEQDLPHAQASEAVFEVALALA
jgi:purine-nucleoside phosphorylase